MKWFVVNEEFSFFPFFRCCCHFFLHNTNDGKICRHSTCRTARPNIICNIKWNVLLHRALRRLSPVLFYTRIRVCVVCAPRTHIVAHFRILEQWQCGSNKSDYTTTDHRQTIPIQRAVCQLVRLPVRSVYATSILTRHTRVWEEIIKSTKKNIEKRRKNENRTEWDNEWKLLLEYVRAPFFVPTSLSSTSLSLPSSIVYVRT